MKQVLHTDSKGRVDLLLLNLARVLTGRLESKIQERVGAPIHDLLLLNLARVLTGRLESKIQERVGAPIHDLLLLNLARVLTGRLESKIQERVGAPIQLWPHVEPLVQSEIKRRKIPARSLTPIEIVGLVSGKKPSRRLKCT